MKLTDKKPLTTALKQHSEQKKLSSEQLEKLMSMQQQAQGPTTAATLDTGNKFYQINSAIISFLRRPVPLYSLASALMLVIIINLIPTPASAPSIIEEIAGHHQEQSHISINSSSLADIGSQLNRLSFKLITSSKLSAEVWQFLGGSYCSINGELAAQLKLKNLQDNQVYTFYQAEYPAALERHSANEISMINAQGTRVSIWKEKGLLLGLAGTETAQ